MDKQTLIDNINNLPKDQYEAVNEFLKKYVLAEKNGGTIEINGDNIQYEEINMEDFFNETISS